MMEEFNVDATVMEQNFLATVWEELTEENMDIYLNYPEDADSTHNPHQQEESNPNLGDSVYEHDQNKEKKLLAKFRLRWMPYMHRHFITAYNALISNRITRNRNFFRSHDLATPKILKLKLTELDSRFAHMKITQISSHLQVLFLPTVTFIEIQEETHPSTQI